MGSSSFWGRSYQPAPSPVFWPFYLAHSCAPIIVIILITADSANNNFIWFVLQFWPRFSVLPAPRCLYCSPVILVRFGSNVHCSISLRKFQEKTISEVSLGLSALVVYLVLWLAIKVLTHFRVCLFLVCHICPVLYGMFLYDFWDLLAQIYVYKT